MIIKNKSTKEILKLTEIEFKRKFAKEIQEAFESYKRTVQAKPYFMKRNIESEFYNDIIWNFNHFGISYWYIEKI